MYSDSGQVSRDENNPEEIVKFASFASHKIWQKNALVTVRYESQHTKN